MNLERAFVIVVALSLAAVSANAQERRTGRETRGGGRATASAPAPSQERSGGRATASAPAPSQERNGRATASAPAPSQERNGRATAPAPDRSQERAQRATPRARNEAPATERRQGAEPAPRAYENRPQDRGRVDQRQPRAVPRSSVRPSPAPNPPGRYAPRGNYRPSYSRPYYYTRLYVRPHNYVRYRPFSFSRPYYTFRPLFSIGFGLWLGDPIPYPYAYLGSYRPRVYGYYPSGGYSVAPSVPVYGGVSFDIEPYDADLFVDGDYVGQVGYFTPTSEPLTLTPGRHLIAVQRPGFRPMEWEVTIEPGLVIPYRGAMDRY